MSDELEFLAACVWPGDSIRVGESEWVVSWLYGEGVAYGVETLLIDAEPDGPTFYLPASIAEQLVFAGCEVTWSYDLSLRKEYEDIDGELEEVTP